MSAWSTCIQIFTFSQIYIYTNMRNALLILRVMYCWSPQKIVLSNTSSSIYKHKCEGHFLMKSWLKTLEFLLIILGETAKLNEYSKVIILPWIYCCWFFGGGDTEGGKKCEIFQA